MKLDDIIEHIKKVNNLSYVMSVLEWDQETNMPPMGTIARSDQISLLAGIQHDLKLKQEFVESIKAIDLKNLSEDNKCIVRFALDDIIKAEKTPKNLIEQIAKTQSLSQSNWVKAKQNNDYNSFKPYLLKLINLKKEYASAISPEKATYDVLLDEYEPNLTMDKIDKLFVDLKNGIDPIFQKIKESKIVIDKSIMNQQFDQSSQEDFAQTVLEDIGFDFDRGRIDISEHPFCTNFSVDDVRITTKFDEKDFTKSLFSLLHEAGHALYEQGMDKQFHATARALPISLGIHESQSRFWENLIGRSSLFWTHYYPILKEHFPKNFKNFPFDKFMMLINEVKANLIRIDADELTYSYHIMIRYEIEKEFFKDESVVNYLPDLWNEKYQNYLGIKAKNIGESCLQDVHWSLGLFGYFPTYTLGNIYSAHFLKQIKIDNNYFDSEVSKGKFTNIKSWLNNNIHTFGKLYTAEDLLNKISKERITSKHYIDYLTEKYSKIYKFN